MWQNNIFLAPESGAIRQFIMMNRLAFDIVLKI